MLVMMTSHDLMLKELGLYPMLHETLWLICPPLQLLIVKVIQDSWINHMEEQFLLSISKLSRKYCSRWTSHHSCQQNLCCCHNFQCIMTLMHFPLSPHSALKLGAAARWQQGTLPIYLSNNQHSFFPSDKRSPSISLAQNLLECPLHFE